MLKYLLTERTPFYQQGVRANGMDSEPLISCVTLSELFKISVHQSPQQKIGIIVSASWGVLRSQWALSSVPGLLQTLVTSPLHLQMCQS